MTEISSRVVNTPASYSEALGSNLGLDTGYPDMFRDFPQTLQVNAGIVPYTRIRPRTLPSPAFRIHHPFTRRL
jgi:hypothetical protein